MLLMLMIFSLRDHYEKIIFLDYHFATSKEIEQSLWKVAFYKVIEEFRLRIRQVYLLMRKKPN
jgi:hypothetical protein